MQNSILLFDLINYCCYVIANYMNNYAINLEPKKEVTHKHVYFDIADKKIIYKVEVIKVRMIKDNMEKHKTLLFMKEVY